MGLLKFRLFGKLSIHIDEQPLAGFELRKAQELLCYLLIFRSQPQSREFLAELLWSDHPASASKKYLRQALWMIQSRFEPAKTGTQSPLLLTQGDWIQVNPDSVFWLDLEQFERAAVMEPSNGGGERDALADFRTAEALYTGSLLEGWYQDWCLFERERLEAIYLTILNRLTDHCISQGEFQDGVSYARKILRLDRANERAHTHLMRLYFLMGNRAEALRQYERCEIAMQDELGVSPSSSTVMLYQNICRDPGYDLGALSGIPGGMPDPAALDSSQMMEYLDHFRFVLSELQRQLQAQIQQIDSLMRRKKQD